MPVIVVKEQFQIAIDGGNKVVTYSVGEHEVSERVALVAVEQLKVATVKKTGGRGANTKSSQAAAED